MTIQWGVALSPFHFEAAQREAAIRRGMPVKVWRKLSWWRSKLTPFDDEWGNIRGSDIREIQLPVSWGGIDPYAELNKWAQARGQAQLAAGR